MDTVADFFADPPARPHEGEVAMSLVRELDADDKLMLPAKLVDKKPPAIDRIRARHHALARCMAGGMSVTEAAMVTGYSKATIYVLTGDPMFKELVVAYQNKKDQVFNDLYERMSYFAIDIHDHLREKFEEDPDSLTVPQLMKLYEMTLDRTGHGPQSSSVATNFNVNVAERLEHARKRAAARTINGQAMESPNGNEGLSLQRTGT